MEQNEFRNTVDMLQGNICRICVSNDTEEINEMCDFAISRILEIKKYRLNRMLSKEE